MRQTTLAVKNGKAVLLPDTVSHLPRIPYHILE